ncbi:MAG: hypothetical protein QM820_54730 [Minicystis sp.]
MRTPRFAVLSILAFVLGCGGSGMNATGAATASSSGGTGGTVGNTGTAGGNTGGTGGNQVCPMCAAPETTGKLIDGALNENLGRGGEPRAPGRVLGTQRLR